MEINSNGCFPGRMKGQKTLEFGFETEGSVISSFQILEMFLRDATLNRSLEFTWSYFNREMVI